MRSEKEIKEKINETYTWDVTHNKDTPKWMKDNKDYLTLLITAYHKRFTEDALNWVLEGKPRYSVAELEKIVRGNEKNEELFYVKDGVIYYIDQSAEYLIKTLKQDKKRVEAILK